MDNATEFAKSTLLTLEGTTIVVESLWSEQPVLFVFLRHFGCMFCRELAGLVRERQSEIEESGVRLVFIGNGTVSMAKAFAEDFAIQSPLYTDPSLKVHAHAGLERGLGSIRSTMKNVWRAWRAGYRPGCTQGDLLQQAGILLVGTDGRIDASCATTTAGSLPDLLWVVDATKSPFLSRAPRSQLRREWRRRHRATFWSVGTPIVLQRAPAGPSRRRLTRGH